MGKKSLSFHYRLKVSSREVYMNRIVAISSKLKYIGLLGLPMFFSDTLIWKYLWLFWLFAFVEIFTSFSTFVQALQQLIAIPYIYISHGFRLPDQNNYQPAIRYSLPFSGQWTAVNGGPDKKTSHSWSILTQRYAYDFLILDDNGQSCSGDKALLPNYYCYGREVLAPADGVVVEAIDKYPDSRTSGNGSVDHTAKDIRGNYIVIRHAAKEYSLIAHLLPQSIKVKAGRQVKRGEHIAQCGNSGNTTEPHIHFQIQDGKSFLASAGLPISFEGIETKPAKNYAKFDPRPVYEQKERDASTIQRGSCVGKME
ncbi:M23 family metallopeptidase [Desulfosporosinus fructosivorans]|nr:M23 family metallopeptidase [Desulfosporosinus fructosivorans]